MMGSSPWTTTPTQPLFPSCLTPAPALQPLDPLVSTRFHIYVHLSICVCVYVCVCVWVITSVCG